MCPCFRFLFWRGNECSDRKCGSAPSRWALTLSGSIVLGGGVPVTIVVFEGSLSGGRVVVCRWEE
jgi:hypothetical protein